MKQPVGILKNTTTNRFHPLVFRPAPMASQADAESDALRHKSQGHHTEGFDTLELAQAWIKQHPHYVDCNVVWGWDGEGTPAKVEWFTKSLIKPEPEPATA